MTANLSDKDSHRVRPGTEAEDGLMLLLVSVDPTWGNFPLEAVDCRQTYRFAATDFAEHRVVVCVIFCDYCWMFFCKLLVCRCFGRCFHVVGFLNVLGRVFFTHQRRSKCHSSCGSEIQQKSFVKAVRFFGWKWWTRAYYPVTPGINCFVFILFLKQNINWKSTYGSSRKGTFDSFFFMQMSPVERKVTPNLRS